MSGRVKLAVVESAAKKLAAAKQQRVDLIS
jgi:hypothetical protein